MTFKLEPHLILWKESLNKMMINNSTIISYNIIHNISCSRHRSTVAYLTLNNNHSIIIKHLLMFIHKQFRLISIKLVISKWRHLTTRIYVKLRHVVATILDSFDAQNIYFRENVISEWLSCFTLPICMVQY